MSVMNPQEVMTAVKADPSIRLQLRAPRNTKLEKPRPLRQTSLEKNQDDHREARLEKQQPLGKTSLEKNADSTSKTIQLRAPKGKKLEKPRPLRQTSLEKNLDEIENKLAAHHKVLMSGDLSRDRLHSLKELLAQHQMQREDNDNIGESLLTIEEAVRKVEDLMDVRERQLNMQDTGKENKLKRQYSSVSGPNTSVSVYNRSNSEPIGKIFHQFCDGEKSPPIADVVSHFTGYTSQKSSDSGFVDMEDMLELAEKRYCPEEHALDTEPETSSYEYPTTPTNSCQTILSVQKNCDNCVVQSHLSDGGAYSRMSNEFQANTQEEAVPSSVRTQNLSSAHASRDHISSTKNEESNDDLDWSDLNAESFTCGIDHYKVPSNAMNKMAPFNSVIISNTASRHQSSQNANNNSTASRFQSSDGLANTPDNAMHINQHDPNICKDNASNHPCTELLGKETDKKTLSSMSLLDYRKLPELFNSASSVTVSVDSARNSLHDDSFNETEYAWELIEDLGDRIENMTIKDMRSPGSENNCVNSKQEFAVNLDDRRTTSDSLVKDMKCVVTRDPISPTTSKEKICKIEEKQQDGSLSATKRRRMFRVYAKAVSTEAVSELSQIVYSVEELVLYSTSPLAWLVPPEWSFLVKIFPEVCMNEVESYFDGQAFLETRKHFYWGNSSERFSDKTFSSTAGNRNGFHTALAAPATGVSSKRVGFPPPRNMNPAV